MKTPTHVYTAQFSGAGRDVENFGRSCPVLPHANGSCLQTDAVQAAEMTVGCYGCSDVASSKVHASNTLGHWHAEVA